MYHFKLKTQMKNTNEKQQKKKKIPLKIFQGNFLFLIYSSNCTSSISNILARLLASSNLLYFSL